VDNERQTSHRSIVRLGVTGALIKDITNGTSPIASNHVMRDALSCEFEEEEIYNYNPRLKINCDSVFGTMHWLQHNMYASVVFASAQKKAVMAMYVCCCM